MELIRKIFLWPFAVIYGVAVTIRNRLFDAGILKGNRFPLPVICVGNITAGGTGKTPHVMYIARHLSESLSTAILSRGYLRNSKGFREISADDNAYSSGDEPLLIAGSLARVKVFVDRDRVKGIETIRNLYPGTEAIILDDGFQHRRVVAGLNIILTSYWRLMTNDILLPAGRLREPLPSVNRADIIIVTKVPETITNDEMEELRREINPGSGQHLFFTTYRYGTPCSLLGGTKGMIDPGSNILLITGIADPSPLKGYLESHNVKITHLSYPDHHRFSSNDAETINREFDNLTGKSKMVITTEKDGVRLKDLANIADRVMQSVYCIPVEVKFIDNEHSFLEILTRYAGKNQKDS